MVDLQFLYLFKLKKSPSFNFLLFPQLPVMLIQLCKILFFYLVLEETINIRKYPEEATYVIIGAGTAAHAACRAIRKKDKNAKVSNFPNIISLFFYYYFLFCCFLITYFYLIYNRYLSLEKKKLYLTCVLHYQKNYGSAKKKMLPIP